MTGRFIDAAFHEKMRIKKVIYDIYFKLSVTHQRRVKKIPLKSHLNAHPLEHMLTDVTSMENKTKLQLQRMINLTRLMFLALQRWMTTKL